MEEWRDIKGYEGRYAISSTGRVKTVERHKSDGRYQAEAIRKTEYDSNGYEFVLLYDNEGYRRHSVHTLVAKAFIDNPCEKSQVNHIDGNKKNNVVDNLEWVTCSENQRHAYRTGLSKPRYGESNPQTKVTDEEVNAIRQMRSEGMTYQKIADDFDISLSHARRIALGLRRKPT